MNLRSFTFRMIFWYSLLFGIVSIGLGTYTYLGVRHYLISSLEKRLLARANHVAKSLVLHLNRTSERTMIQGIETLFSPANSNRFIRILRPDGTTLYVSGQPSDASFDSSRITPPDQSMSSGYTRHEKTLNNNTIYIASVPIAPERAGEHFWFELGAPNNEIRNALEGLTRTLFMAFPVVMFCAAGGGYMLMKRSLSPVTTIIDSAEKITLRNLSKRLPTISSGDVFEHLSQSLNRMIKRLEDSFQQVKRFTEDASHELRTPLTIIRGELELLTQEPHLPEDLVERIGSALEEVERLARITEGLFVISHLDSGMPIVMKKYFFLGELVTNTLEQMSLLTEEKGLSLKEEITPYISVLADPDRIKQVIVNLIDNAIKYTPPHGTIRVSVYTKEGKAIFEIEDTGIGIAKENIPYVFRRFYRADKARSRALGGAGLGLSIVWSICMAHEGDITVQSEEGKGSLFTVELPLEGAQSEEKKQRIR